MKTWKHRLPLWLLLVAHLAGDAPVAAISNFPQRTSSTTLQAVFAYLAGQSVLLGLWIALGISTVPRRILGIVSGLLLVWCTWLPFLEDETDRMLAALLITTLALGMAGPLLIVQRGRARLSWFADPPSAPSLEGLRFSVRHMLLLTLVVGVLLSLRRILQTLDDTLLERLVVLAVIGICFVVVGLTSVWACLGVGGPIARLFLLLLVSAAASLVFFYCFWDDATGLIPAFAVTTLQTFLVAGSLLIARACGYRLVKIGPESSWEVS